MSETCCAVHPYSPETREELSNATRKGHIHTIRRSILDTKDDDNGVTDAIARYVGASE